MTLTPFTTKLKNLGIRGAILRFSRCLPFSNWLPKHGINKKTAAELREESIPLPQS
jgi:hypothetical protein